LCSISFFIQAEDVIRDATVTGVQTCALPIYAGCQDLRDWRRNERDSAHRDRAAAAWQSHRLTQVRVCPSFTSMHWSLASLSRLSNRLISLPGLKPGELDYCWDNHRLPHGCFPQGREGNCFEARDLDQWKPAGDPRGHSRGR